MLDPVDLLSTFLSFSRFQKIQEKTSRRSQQLYFTKSTAVKVNSFYDENLGLSHSCHLAPPCVCQFFDPLQIFDFFQKMKSTCSRWHRNHWSNCCSKSVQCLCHFISSVALKWFHKKTLRRFGHVDTKSTYSVATYQAHCACRIERDRAGSKRPPLYRLSPKTYKRH